MAEHNELGRKGEDLAAHYLQSKGYRLLHRNWVYEKDEIDLVCFHKDLLVFIEVKTRSSALYGHPEEAVSASKREKLLRVIDAYLNKYQIDQEIRIDILSILIQDNKEKIYHIEDAIAPDFED
ncbi:MAG: YraN family protein [Bacteroidetes bacterium]|nr:YraN family protein [Bacteroidota bacterium]